MTSNHQHQAEAAVNQTGLTGLDWIWLITSEDVTAVMCHKPGFWSQFTEFIWIILLDKPYMWNMDWSQTDLIQDLLSETLLHFKVFKYNWINNKSVFYCLSKCSDWTVYFDFNKDIKIKSPAKYIIFYRPKTTSVFGSHHVRITLLLILIKMRLMLITSNIINHITILVKTRTAWLTSPGSLL